MTRLTARMIQNLESDLRQYHALFDGDRCKGWELEELIVKAIKSDTGVNHHPLWKEAGHDDKADIVVRDNGHQWPVNIKSGQIKNDQLTLSGHRLGRFKGDLQQISNYLNNSETNMMAVPYFREEDANGRHHAYQVVYIGADHIHGIESAKWQKHGKQYRQTNLHGVEFSLRPSMSWQIWWTIPMDLVKRSRLLAIT